MTHDEFEDRVDWWRGRLDELGLSHWDFHFEYEEGGLEDSKGVGAEATITVHRTYDTAWWHVPEKTLGLPNPDIDKIIVHELMHVLLRSWNKADADMLDVIGGQLAKQFEERLEHEMEGVVERLARAIVISATLLDSMHNFTEDN